MSLQSQVAALITAIGADIKTVFSRLTGLRATGTALINRTTDDGSGAALQVGGDVHVSGALKIAGVPLSQQATVGGHWMIRHDFSIRSYTGGTWYRFLSFAAVHDGQSATVLLRSPGGHDSVEIQLARHTSGIGNAGWVAQVRRMGSYAYAYNITRVRVCDDGVNGALHLEMQLGESHGSLPMAVWISGAFWSAAYGVTVTDMTPGAMGALVTRELFISDGVASTSNQTLLGLSVRDQDALYVNALGRVGIKTQTPAAEFVVASGKTLLNRTTDDGSGAVLQVGGAISVNGTPVVGNRQPAIASPAADLASLKAAVDSLRTTLKNHGLTD